MGDTINGDNDVHYCRWMTLIMVIIASMGDTIIPYDSLIVSTTCDGDMSTIKSKLNIFPNSWLADGIRITIMSTGHYYSCM